MEYIWAHCKHHELPNVCAKNLWDLSEGARRSLKRMRRRPQVGDLKTAWASARERAGLSWVLVHDRTLSRGKAKLAEERQKLEAEKAELEKVRTTGPDDEKAETLNPIRIQ